MKFRPDIEGLRAIAVGLVVLSHLEVTGFKGGFVGVDIFFVISGYLITGLITSEFDKKELAHPGEGWVSLRTFYFRRVKRIIPVSFFVIIVTTATSFILLNSIRAKTVLNDAIWSALFSANIHFIRIATDYFRQGAATSPLQHYWSLAVEEQFYLVIPALFILAINVRRVKIARISPSWGLRIKSLFSAIVITSFIWSIFSTANTPASAYFSSFSRAWELGVGALLAVWTHQSTFKLRKVSGEILELIGLGLIGFSTIAYSSNTNFPGYAALAPVLGSSLLIFCGSEGSGFITRVLGTKILTGLGRVSYSVYLWHWPMIILLSATHPHILKTIEGKFFFVIVTLLISYASFKLVEQPIRQIPIPEKWRREKYRPTKLKILTTIATIAAILTVGVLVTNTIHTQNSPRPSQPITSTPSRSVPPTALSKGSYTQVLDKWSQKILASTFVATVKGITPSFEVTQGYDTWRNPDCTHQSTIFGVAEIKNLAICKEGSGTNIALFIGNSHARMLQRAVTQPFVKSGWTIYSFFMPWCMIPNLNGIDHKFDKVYDCNLYHNDLKILLAEIKPKAVIVSERLFPTMSFSSAGKVYAANTNESVFWSLYQQELSEIKRSTSSLIVLGVTPELPKPISECVDAQSNLDLMCQANGAAISETVTRQSNATRGAGATFIDSRDWLCYKAVACPAIIDNTMVYKDLDHTSFPIESKLSLLFYAFLKKHSVI